MHIKGLMWLSSVIIPLHRCLVVPGMLVFYMVMDHHGFVEHTLRWLQYAATVCSACLHVDTHRCQIERRA